MSGEWGKVGLRLGNGNGSAVIGEWGKVVRLLGNGIRWRCDWGMGYGGAV